MGAYLNYKGSYMKLIIVKGFDNFSGCFLCFYTIDGVIDDYIHIVDWDKDILKLYKKLFSYNEIFTLEKDISKKRDISGTLYMFTILDNKDLFGKIFKL